MILAASLTTNEFSRAGMNRPVVGPSHIDSMSEAQVELTDAIAAASRRLADLTRIYATARYYGATSIDDAEWISIAKRISHEQYRDFRKGEQRSLAQLLATIELPSVDTSTSDQQSAPAIQRGVKYIAWEPTWLNGVISYKRQKVEPARTGHRGRALEEFVKFNIDGQPVAVRVAVPPNDSDPERDESRAQTSVHAQELPNDDWDLGRRQVELADLIVLAAATGALCEPGVLERSWLENAFAAVLRDDSPADRSTLPFELIATKTRDPQLLLMALRSFAYMPAMRFDISGNRIKITATGPIPGRHPWAHDTLDYLGGRAAVDILATPTEGPWNRGVALRYWSVARELIGPQSTFVGLRYTNVLGGTHDCNVARVRAFLDDIGRPPPIANIAAGVIYFDLSRVDPVAFRNACATKTDAKEVVFDLRGPVAPEIARECELGILEADAAEARLDVPWVCTLDEYQQKTASFGVRTWKLPAASPTKVVAIVDWRTVGFAELMAHALARIDGSVILGQETAGCRRAATEVLLPRGQVAFVSVGRVLSKSGVDISSVAEDPPVVGVGAARADDDDPWIRFAANLAE